MALTSEVVRNSIAPYLDYESRINLNRSVLPGHRLCKRMNSDSIKKHECHTIVAMIHGIIDRIHTKRGHDKYKLMIHLFKIHLYPRYFKILQDHEIYREIFLKKISETILDLNDTSIQIDLIQRLKLVSVSKKLRNKIQMSGPYLA